MTLGYTKQRRASEPGRPRLNQASSACVIIVRFKVRPVPLLQCDLRVTDALRLFFLSVGFSFLKPVDGESLGARCEALEVKRLQA